MCLRTLRELTEVDLSSNTWLIFKSYLQNRDFISVFSKSDLLVRLCSDFSSSCLLLSGEKMFKYLIIVSFSLLFQSALKNTLD